MNDGPLEYLIRRAGADEQVALARLTELRNQLDDNQRQLETLFEYLEKPTPASGGRIDAGRHARTRRFAAQVDDVARSQRERVASLEQACEQAHDAWGRLRASRRALERLREKRRETQMLAARKSDQRELDEVAGNYWFANHGDSRA